MNTNNTSAKPAKTPEVWYGVRMWIIKAIIGLLFFAAIMALSSGRWDWVWGWVFVGLFAIAGFAHVVILVLINPALLAERSRGLREEGARGWDRFIAGMAAGLLPMISWIIAGLDIRFGWSPSMGLAWHLGGAFFFCLGWALVLWATASNAFFSTTVRIQKERGHTVQTGGPYRFVRHPGYVGAILYQLATPFLLGSWWALIPMLLTVPLYAVRAVLEENLLRNELEGYRAYADRVRSRLLPGVW